ncbi:MAG: hypothetical protein GY705_12375, partial [Bacteroidetes bacterium]|nr:hypothetical protein [Bacteroidota bacterium]
MQKSLYPGVDTPSQENSIQNGGFMHHKNIKLIVRKQLKKKFPNWKSLNRKIKREISRKVLAEIETEYDFNQDVVATREELFGIEQQVPAKGIIKLNEMARFVNMVNDNRIIKFSNYKRSPIYIKDKELQFVDGLIDDRVTNRLLSYKGYSPVMRDIFPSNLFRAELLKAIKFPEISYRKFCKEDYLGLDQKQNRVFVGLSLSKKDMIDH